MFPTTGAVIVAGSSARHNCAVALVSVLPRRDTQTSSSKKKITPVPSASRSKRGISVMANHHSPLCLGPGPVGGRRDPDSPRSGGRCPLELSPLAPLAVGVPALEPERTAMGHLANVSAALVPVGVFVNPGTANGVLGPHPVADLGEHLEVAQVVGKVEFGSVIRGPSPHKPRWRELPSDERLNLCLSLFNR